MLKNISRLEHKIGERLFHLTCDMDTPLSEVRESLQYFMSFVDQVEENIKSMQQKQECVECNKEVSEEVV